MKYVSDANKLPWQRSMAFADAIKGGVGWLEVGIRQKAKPHITTDIECHERLGGLLSYYDRKAA